MKKFQQWVFIFGLALAGQARAADGGAPAVEAGKTANIEGKVIVAGTGQPLSGVKLRWLMTNDMREPVLSGPDGAFRLANITPGRAAITAVFPGEPVADWVAEDVLLTVAPGETRKDVLVRGMKGGVAVITVLSQKDRKPLANVPVSASSQLSPSPIVAVTGTDGTARMRLLPDGWHISASLEVPQHEAQTYLVVATGHTNTAELLVDPGLKITGTVRDPAGTPAVGAVVSIVGNLVSSHQVMADANGRYELTRRPFNGMDAMIAGGATLFMTARSADRNLVVMHDIEQDTTNLDLTLQPSVTLSARVEDPAGQPVTNAVANAYPIKEGRVYREVRTNLSSSDVQGHIEFSGLPQWDAYYLVLSAKGYGLPLYQQIQLPDPPTNRLELPTIVLAPANQKLGGQILDTDGKPVAGVMVQAVAFTNRVQPSADKPDAWDVVAVMGRSQGNAQTDSEGRFFFDEVCEGLIQLDINYQGSSIRAQTIGGTTNILLRLDLGNVPDNDVPWPVENSDTTITGTVREPSGAPAGGVRIGLWGGDAKEREVRTGADGRYSISLNWRQQTGATQLLIVARDLEHNLAASHEINETTTNVDLSLQPGLTLSFRVQDVNGQPIPSARETLTVKVENRNWNLSQIPLVADEQGLIEIRDLPQGRRYSATLTSRGYNVADFQAPAEQTQTPHFESPIIVLRVADRKIAGQVLGPDNKPFPGADVFLTEAGQQVCNTTTTTDADGRFAFDALYEGTFLVEASRGAADSNVEASVEAHGGETNILLKLGLMNGLPSVLPRQP